MTDIYLYLIIGCSVTIIILFIMWIILFIQLKKTKKQITDIFDTQNKEQQNFIIQINDTISRFEDEVKYIIEKDADMDEVVQKVLKKHIELEEQKMKFLESIKEHQVVLNKTAINFCLDESRIIDIIPNEYIEKLLQKKEGQK